MACGQKVDTQKMHFLQPIHILKPLRRNQYIATMKKINLLTFLLTSLLWLPLNAQNGASAFIVGDVLPDAPKLAHRGEFKVGVQTTEVIHKDQVDILNRADSVDPIYDRNLILEVWYPAQLAEGQQELETYQQVHGSKPNKNRPIIPFTYEGRAARDAEALYPEDPYPLIVVSHGYVGSRLLMSYLTENLASKGYIVVAIDHKESTYADGAGFQSTLLNRPKDILFVIDEIARLSAQKDHFLHGLVNANNTGIVGYSMGGYGVLNVGGAGYSEQLSAFFTGMTGGSKAITDLIWNKEEYKNSFDPRVKALVAFAPWGMERGVWDTDGLKGLKIPSFIVAGSEDDVSGYEKGVKAIYDGAVNADRYLLTYINARHNVAPNAPPAATLDTTLNINEFYRYAEPTWDEERMNNINQHFVTAFFGIHLKGLDYGKYLDLPLDSNEQNWEGFKPRTSTGMELRHNSPEGN